MGGPQNGDAVKEIIRREVGDWDDNVLATARFKAFSGQRPDWQPRYVFWRDLILKIARHLGLISLSPSQVKNEWFNRGGLTPLCLDHVLCLMYDEGDAVLSGDLVDPTRGRLLRAFARVRKLVYRPALAPEQVMLQDRIILVPLLKDRVDEVVRLLSESHWTSSCIVTMKKFQDICGGSTEATAVLSYLSGCGKAQYLSLSKKDFIEGVKVSLTAGPVSTASSLDNDVLHLVWTSEKLQKQIVVIDQRCESVKKIALVALKLGNKKVALRNAKELKLISGNREKWISLLNRVEEVLNVIADAETTKKVSEVMQIGAQAIKQNGVTVEDVEHCLDELEEGILSQKQVEKALEAKPLFTDVEDEDIEAEFKELELELNHDEFTHPVPQVGGSSSFQEAGTSEPAEQLSVVFSNMKLQDGSSRQPENRTSETKARNDDAKLAALEAA